MGARADIPPEYRVDRLGLYAGDILHIDPPLLRAAHRDATVLQQEDAGVVAVVDSENDHEVTSAMGDRGVG
jgi:hypothetical protein